MRSVTQLIPARGRKLIPKKDGGGKLATQLIPARGRKRLPAAFEPNFRKTQLIPARGRKPGPERGALLRLLDTTYPREGTETPYRAR